MQKLIATWAWLNAHPQVKGYLAGAIIALHIAVVSAIARQVPRPGPEAAWWKRVLYDLIVDMPAVKASQGRAGILGGSWNIPGVPSRLPEDNPKPSETKALRDAKTDNADGGAK